MNNIITLSNGEFGKVRTVEQGGKILFCGSDVAKALGYCNANDAISRHCRAIVKRDTPISGKIQSINFIPEGDVYRLICHSKLPSAERFEKWLFDDVVPTIRKTGKYENNTKHEQLKLETSEYFYQDKYWNGVPVVTLADIEHKININRDTMRSYLKANCINGIDYAILTKEELAQFKRENPSAARGTKAITIVTKSGFIKLIQYYSSNTEMPKCFQIEVKAKSKKQPKPVINFTTTDCITALNVLKYIKEITKNKLAECE